MKIHINGFIAPGTSPEDFGMHLIRKCAAKFVATGCTVPPPVASLYLKENWTLWGVKDRYIKYEGAGDQFFGRDVSEIPILKK